MKINIKALFRCQSRVDFFITPCLGFAILFLTSQMNKEILFSLAGLQLAVINSLISAAILARMGGDSYQPYLAVFIQLFPGMFIFYTLISIFLF